MATSQRTSAEMREQALPVPRLSDRRAAARYLSISVAQLDVLRLRGEIAPVPMPGRNGEPIRTPLYDRLALDRAIERWEARGGR